MTTLSTVNPRPVAQIVTRRHPMAFALYTVVFCLGLIFVFQLFGADQRQQDVFPDINPWVIFAWKWMMVLGGGGALVALCMKARVTPNWPDLADLLHLEGIAAIVAAFGVGTYAFGAISESGFGNSTGALAFFVPIIVGHVWRSQQAIRQGAALQALAQDLQDLSPHEGASFTQTEEQDNGGGD